MEKRHPGSDTDRALAACIPAAQRGDREAFDTLARHYRPLLLTLAFLRTADTQESNDLVQDVLTQAWRRLPTLKDPAALPAWLRALMVHACNHWYRSGQRRAATVPLDEALLASAGPGGDPVAALLCRERQHRLHRALWALPQANRLALLLQVWGGYSYGEIAALTDVRASTVEGRIYRAKRQLRDHFQGQTVSYLVETPREENTMSLPSLPIVQSDDPDRSLHFVLFIERFSHLIDGGVSLVRGLLALEEMAPPYGPALGEIARRVEAGERLSVALNDFPALFSRAFVGLVCAGEVAGILEEAFQRARRAARREWELTRRRPAHEKPLDWILPSTAPPPQEWSDLTHYQQLVSLDLFCSALSFLLASGVPILYALSVVAALLPSAQQEDMEQVRAAVRDAVAPHQALALLGILPGFALVLIEVGFVSGTLHSTLFLAAETFEQELDCRFG